MSGLRAVDVYKKLKAAVDTESIPMGGVHADGGVSTEGPAFVTAGVASGIARRHWEEGEEIDDLAEAPTKAQQAFIK